MAKGQKRSNKEQRKQKCAGKKGEGPRYMRPAELVQPSKSAPARPASKR